MKQKALTLVVALILIVSACSPAATPTVNAADVQHTAEAAAFTMVAQTQAAIPSNTPNPPTDIPSPTVQPTLTFVPSLSADTALPTFTGVATAQSTSLPPTSIPPIAASTEENCNKALTAWEGPTANFAITNETKPQGKIILSLYVKTELGECGYLSDLSRGPIGQYSAGAFVDGKKSFKVFGGFRITEGNWKIVVRNESITALGGCYPSC